MAWRRLVALLTLGLLMLWAIPSPLQAQPPQVQLWWVGYHNTDDLARLVHELDVWEVDHARKVLLAPLDSAAAAQLAASRPVELSEDQTPIDIQARSASQTSGIPGYPCYRTVDETHQAIDDLVAAYPNLTRIEPIGQSWDAISSPAAPGDELRVLVITNRAVQPPLGLDKPRFFLMGAVHARELTTTETALRFAEVLLTEYGVNAETTWLLDHHELHLLPIANPDGRRIAETGQLWRKNTNTSATCGVGLPSFSYGVDLNRNSSFQWNVCSGCSSSSSCSMIYRGPSPASEPETQAVESYLRRIFPDRRAADLAASAPDDTTGLMVSLHSYSELVLFPWGWTATASPNARQLATLARRFGAPLNYPACAAPACLYATDGSTDDWVYGELGIPGFTFELGTAFFQSCTDFETTIWPDTLKALRYGLNVAAEPYRLPGGPATLDLVTTRDTVIAGMQLTLTATTDDSGYGSFVGSADLLEPVRTIHHAAAAIGVPPWRALASSTALTASDGAFDSELELITGAVDTTCLPTGQHTLFVQGQDDASQWGPPAATFITITNTSPFTLTAAPLDPMVFANTRVTYTLQITNTGALSTSFAVRGSSVWPLSFPMTTTTPIAPQHPVTLTFTVDIPKNTAGTSVPAVITVSSSGNPTECRRLEFYVAAPLWRLAFPTLHLAD